MQRRVELEVTGGRTLIPSASTDPAFVAPAWVAFFAVPFELFGTNLGGRLWILFGLACLAVGLYLAVRPRAPAAAILPAFRICAHRLLLLNAQLDESLLWESARRSRSGHESIWRDSASG